MADTTNDLDSKANAKPFLRIATADTTWDTVIEFFITQLSLEFNRYCRRDLKARARTDYYDGNGLNKLFVNHYPINSITKLYIDSDRVYGADTEIAAADYILYKEIGLITLDGSLFPDAPQSVKLEYNGGLSTIPSDLLGAFRAQLKFNFARWKDGEEGLTARTLADGSITISAEDFIAPVKRILDQYRRKSHASVAHYG